MTKNFILNRGFSILNSILLLFFTILNRNAFAEKLRYIGIEIGANYSIFSELTGSEAKKIGENMKTSTRGMTDFLPAFSLAQGIPIGEKFFITFNEEFFYSSVIVRFKNGSHNLNPDFSYRRNFFILHPGLGFKRELGTNAFLITMSGGLATIYTGINGYFGTNTSITLKPEIAMKPCFLFRPRRNPHINLCLNLQYIVDLNETIAFFNDGGSALFTGFLIGFLFSY